MFKHFHLRPPPIGITLFFTVIILIAIVTPYYHRLEKLYAPINQTIEKLSQTSANHHD